MCELSPVSFHGDTIFCVTIDNQPYAPAKPIVENMGVSWQGQQAKLSTNKERWGIKMFLIPSEQGDQQTLCMPVRKLPAFLASINPRKVKPELREKIELYQRECDDALWDYWTKGRAERQPDALPDSITPEQQAQLHAIVAAKVGMLPKPVQRKAYAEAWTRFCRHFRIARYAQLPPAKMGEAVDYLVNVEWKAAAALPPSSSEIPNNSPAAMPVPVDAPKQLDILHRARERCRFEFLPQAYSSLDREAAERSHLAKDLYKLQDCLWAALYNVCSAAARLRA